ncbi:Metallo-dependent phosphatase-like protein [Trametes punicea]|nr:Metallo-dependent phosphatase-like protein [Trametes punicea]
MTTASLAIPKRKLTRIPTAWEQFRYSPTLFIARQAYAAFSSPQLQQEEIADTNTHVAPTVRIVCIADTHNAQGHIPPLPPGDILIHAGDLTQLGTEREIHDALNWINSAPHTHKVFIAGNHDAALAIPECRDAILAAYPDLVYLEDSSATLTVRGHTVTLYGSPRTPKRGAGVFQYPQGEATWAIPSDTDILVTHGPPKYHLDVGGFGCRELLRELWQLRPLMHVFGHIHGGRGVEQATWCRYQRSYETVSAKTGGMAAALEVVLGALSAKVRTQLLSRTWRREGTLLVNAAWWGKQVEQPTEGAVVVDLALSKKLRRPPPTPPSPSIQCHGFFSSDPGLSSVRTVRSA